MAMNNKQVEKLQAQLQKERRLVSFDNYDISVKQLIDMRKSGAIHVPPEYQRQFVWDSARESQLIESVFLGIPVPNVFMATNEDSTWEVVDGVQRLGSLAHFVGSQELLEQIEKEGPLVIEGLEKLSELNGKRFTDLPATLQLLFETRPLRATVLNDKSDLNVRFDLFERLNTGGVLLTNQEIRNCIFRGKLNDHLKKLSKQANFIESIRLKPSDASNGAAEELVLRFFAYLECYQQFDHSVKDFLNGYMKERASKPLKHQSVTLFNQTFDLIGAALPDGIVRGNRAVTPINLFEAVAVGCALALKAGKTPDSQKLKGVVNSAGLKKLTTGATNNRNMVSGRIEFVANAV
ncbi:protein of unknown function DUF262 [Leptothrix cholodnii SP-6]|uniref:GmrSD restriction endonucleases N-terminal domain-containing protein n=1 Tax=Leptothrix cholodnii (strain ATCC 51168 / LMG 8142 / SP-6) TaxID=395495 RepID=B1XYH4_LEPCP|nr:DUF262 domain-containing protein [Leptothrix cholodnii]ACB35219.1 protein of unknown function DUF262 [Leptothrix cholodnii SP-6]